MTLSNGLVTIVTTFTLVGSILSTINNSTSFISPIITVIGIILVIVILIAVNLYIRCKRCLFDDGSGNMMSLCKLPIKYYLMSFGLIVALIVPRISDYVYPKAPSEKEISSVVSLVNDIKKSILIVNGVLVRPHIFIDDTWLKDDNKLNYYRGISAPLNLFQLLDQTFVKKDLFQKLNPSRGQWIGKIKDFGLYSDDPHGGGFLAMSSAPPTSTAERVKSSEIDGYLSCETLLTPEVRSHANDVYLPKQIRNSIRKLNAIQTVPISFGKCLGKDRDFFIIMYSQSVNPFLDLKKRNSFALFYNPATSDILSLTDLYVDLFNSIVEWQAKYKIDLNLIEKNESPHAERSISNSRLDRP